MFSPDRIAAIFGNIEEIFRFARLFLADLEKQIIPERPELSEIGTCFIRQVSVEDDL